VGAAVRDVTTTYLEMRSPAELKPRTCADPRFAVREATVRQWPFNRFLYAFVGAAWAWTDKLGWTDAEWEAYVGSEQLRTFVGYYDGSVAGYYELHRAPDGDVEIVYFGLAPPFIGQGLGAALLTHALAQAWGWAARRVWVHTCSLDHPAALHNYQARGMRVYDVQVHPRG
jgi:GNAT superfamily N-acetyltransferase